MQTQEEMASNLWRQVRTATFYYSGKEPFYFTITVVFIDLDRVYSSCLISIPIEFFKHGVSFLLVDGRWSISEATSRLTMVTS